MTAYLLARLWTGRLTPTSRATLDNIELFWRYTMLQGALIAAGGQLLPRAMARAPESLRARAACGGSPAAAALARYAARRHRAFRPLPSALSPFNELAR